MERIQKELSQFYSSDKIKKTLLERGIKLRTLEEQKQCKIEYEGRKYLVNDNYCLESHNGAWILGMYSADGYLPFGKNGAGNRLVLSLAEKDKEILYMIAKEIEYEGEIHTYLATDKIHSFASLAFTSKVLRKKFEDYGIVNNKTYKMHKLPNIPDEFMIDYIRGYIDGDGSIYEKRGHPIFSICSANRDFLEEVQKYLLNKFELKSSISKDHNVFQLSFGAAASRKLGHLMYDNNYLALPRKKKRFYEIITPKSLDIPQE